MGISIEMMMYENMTSCTNVGHLVHQILHVHSATVLHSKFTNHRTGLDHW